MKPLTLNQRKAISEADRRCIDCDDSTLLTRLNIARRLWMRFSNKSNMAECDRLLDECLRRRLLR